MKTLSTPYISPIRRISLIGPIGLICLIGLIGAPSTARASILLKSPPNNMGLVGFWNFNAGAGTTVADSSGSGNTGTWAGTGSHWTGGKFSNGGSFNGTDDYVRVTQASSINNLKATGMTISAWIKSASSTGVIVAKKDIDGVGGSWDFRLGNTRGILFHAHTAGSDLRWATVNNAYSLNTWQHVAMAWAGPTSTVSIYVNGVEVTYSSTGAGSGTFDNDSASDVFIGNGSAMAASEPFTGVIDEVRIYKRVLSATEVRTLYNSTGVGKVNSSRNNPASNLQNGLVLWHTFDGNKLSATVSTDNSTNGNNGTLFGANGKPVPVTGKVGQSLKFDGVDDYLQVPNSTSLNFYNQSNFSASFWMKTSSAFSTYLTLLAQGVYSNDGWILWSNSGKLQLVMNQVGQIERMNGTTILAQNTWYHVVVIKNGATGKIYVNGIDDNATLPDGSLVDGGGSGRYLTIGAFNDGPVYPFPGTIDDVRIYNRALSAAEVLQLYNATGGGNRVNATLNNPVSNLQSGLVGWWPFDGKYLTTTTATDLGSGHNNGTRSGGVATTIGKLGQALKFDGTDDYVALPANLFSSNNLSISLWAKFNLLDTYQALFSLITNDNDAMEIFVNLAGSTLVGGNFNNLAVLTNNSISIGPWYHVVLTSDGATTRLYLNGVANGNTGTTHFSTFSGAVRIGGRSSGSFNFNGSIDDVRIYNRALSAGEVLQLYNMGK